MGFRFYNVVDYKIFNSFGVEFVSIDIERTVPEGGLVKQFVLDLLSDKGFMNDELLSINFDLVVSYGMLGWLKNNDGSSLSNEQIDNAIANIKLINPKYLMVSTKNYDDPTHLNGLANYFKFSFTFSFNLNGSLYRNQVSEFVF